MVLLLALLVSTVAGLTAFLLIARWPHADPALDVSEAIEEDLRARSGPGSFVRDRTDPAKATGLALTVALIGLVVAGVVVGLLAWTIRRDAGLVDVDHAVEIWADEHATPLSDDVLGAITHLGDTTTILVVGVAISAYGLWRFRRPAIPLFVAFVVVGQILISNTIKTAIDRARPELRPRADFSGTSFPSGHTTAAAATYLAVALVLGIASSPRARAALAGAAVAIGVAVGCTRVLLGVHWFSDVLAGLAIGWSWFGICGVAFGGRLLRFGAPADTALTPTARADPISAGGREPQSGREVRDERGRSKARVLPTRRRGRETPPRARERWR